MRFDQPVSHDAAIRKQAGVERSLAPYFHGHRYPSLENRTAGKGANELG
jgi:hypothetical protein